VPDISLIDNSTVENYKYTGGTNGSSVELFKVVGGSHSWPGALPIIPNTNQDFNASVEIWRFFRQYKLNQFIPNVGITNTTYNENDILIYPNPTYGLLSIKSETSKKIEIINELGQQVYYVYSDVHTSSNIIDISHLPRGVYFLKINNNNSLVYKKIVKL
jgi:polyhydroxybutyrate depolymerase